jgi:hypothetical protein
VDDCPKPLEQIMIIGDLKLAGENCAADGVLHPMDGALDLLRVRRHCPAVDAARCIEPFVEVGLLASGRSVGQCQG